MTIQEFELQLKEIDPKFEIVPHPNNPQLAGVYYDRNIENKTGFIVTVPADEIKEDYDPSYRDRETQYPHNWASKVRYICTDHLKKLETNESYRKVFYEKLKNR